MLSWLTFLVASLATYRLARMLALEEGPASIFVKFRSKFLNQIGEASNWIGRGVTCPLCIGFWLAPVMLELLYFDWSDWIIYWLAIAGLQTAIQKQER